MVTDVEFKIKLILGDVQELLDRADELDQNVHWLVSYSYDWNNSLIRLSKIWHLISEEQRKAISDAYGKVKPLASKFKLDMPEELAGLTQG